VGDRASNVLLVDDQSAQRLALAAILGDLDVNLVQAASGRDALRCVLQQEFAVILLDVNMPGLDGFETAALIRARPSCEHTPIIFVTAYSDDAHAARGYSLGAVDFILSPVRPDVLRTKVSVFIDLFRKTAEVTRQREALGRHADQLRQLSRASLAIHSARSVEDVLGTAVEQAIEIVGARQGAALASAHAGVPPVSVAVRTKVLGGRTRAAAGAVVRQPLLGAYRATVAEVDLQPPWTCAAELAQGQPMRGWLAAPLTAYDGRGFGSLQLSDKIAGEFSEEDESILMQLAQMAAIAVENTLAAEAREANRLKDEFLSVLSHELRTPLQAMLTWIGILRSERADAAMLPRGLEVIERSARAQVRLIGDLLDVSRIVRGQLRLETGVVDLVTVIELALETLRPAADSKGLTIDWNTPVSSCRIEGDAARLQQVVANLVSNAIKFTPKCGRVALELHIDATQLRLTVLDSGPGIPPEFLPHVFERFRQADTGSARGHGGLGLGLAIVHHLIQLHGGTVHADNAPGGGALLTVTLPRRPVIPSAVRREGAHLMLPARQAHGVWLDGIRVVLVEDEADAREALSQALRALGAHVVAVESAEAALSALDEALPDVLLSDIGMPGRDGYDLIQTVRAREAGNEKRLPAAALTAYARAEDYASALRAGFDAHVHKPIEPLELARVVRQLTHRAS
jgi:signal transduction histidine kinase/ActR/RegA family two-component response regulator